MYTSCRGHLTTPTHVTCHEKTAGISPCHHRSQHHVSLSSNDVLLPLPHTARHCSTKVMDEHATVITRRAEEEGLGSKDEPTVVRTVDFTKTSDAYQKVLQWQETGKKSFP